MTRRQGNSDIAGAPDELPTGPVLGPIHRKTGVAGQVAYSVDVTYTYGTVTETNRATFYGSLYGTPGPVHASFGSRQQVRVDSPERFGDKFSAAWVRAYYGPTG